MTTETTEQRPIVSGFGSQATVADIVSGINVHGKTAVVTGGNSGIGLETTRALFQAGAAVVVGARDLERAEQQLAGTGRIEMVELDLAEPDPVDRFAETFLRSHSGLDFLINHSSINPSRYLHLRYTHP